MTTDESIRVLHVDDDLRVTSVADAETALGAAREGICTLDADGRVRYATDAYLDLYGCEADELVGEPWRRLHPGEDVDPIVAGVLPAVDEDGESVGLRADGTTVGEPKSVGELPDGGYVVVTECERSPASGERRSGRRRKSQSAGVGGSCVFRLYLATGTHLTADAGDRVREAEAALGDVDVVFVEDPRVDPPPLRVRLANWATVPLVLVAVLCWTTLLRLVSGRTPYTDAAVVGDLADDGAPVVPVDRNYHRTFAQTRLAWAVGHYVLAGLAVFPAALFVAVFPPARAAGMSVAVVLVAGVGMWMLVLAGTLPARDAAMAEAIAAHAAETEAETGVAVLGRAHREGVRAALARRPGVEVVEASGPASAGARDDAPTDGRPED